jgi:hypothetical protein
MTTRQTSREAYEELCKSGKLRGQQEQVLASIVRYGASTSGELLAKMEIDNVNAWRARFTELQARGLIAESTVRECKVTGKRAIVWEYTGRTKPLDAKKGHRVDGKAWKALALDAIRVLERGHGTVGEHEATKLRTRAESLS